MSLYVDYASRLDNECQRILTKALNSCVMISILTDSAVYQLIYSDEARQISCEDIFTDFRIGFLFNCIFYGV